MTTITETEINIMKEASRVHIKPKTKCFYCDVETECRDRCGFVPICDTCEENMADDVSESDDDDDDDDEDDILRCEKCGYEDYKNDNDEWTEVLTHTETDKVFCKTCMPKKQKKRILIIEEDNDDDE